MGYICIPIESVNYFTLTLCSCLFYKSQAQKLNWDQISNWKLLLQSPAKRYLAPKSCLTLLLQLSCGEELPAWRELNSNSRVNCYTQRVSCDTGERPNNHPLEPTHTASLLYPYPPNCLFCGEERNQYQYASSAVPGKQFLIKLTNHFLLVL